MPAHARNRIVVQSELLTLQRFHHGPHPACFSSRDALGIAHRRDFLENPQGQLFDGIERFGIVAQIIGGKRGESQCNLGRLLRELIHLIFP
jgi:hypothetical protein